MNSLIYSNLTPPSSFPTTLLVTFASLKSIIDEG
jgi:hypothetical protein